MFYMPKQASVSGNMRTKAWQPVGAGGVGAKIHNELCRALATGILTVH